MQNERRDRFLATPRYAYLTTRNKQSFPVTVPVWFDWDGSLVLCQNSADFYAARQ